MNNIDHQLSTLVKEQFNDFDIDQYISSDRIEGIVKNLIESEIIRHIAMKSHATIYGKLGVIIDKCLDDLIKDKKFILSLKDAIRINIIEN